MGYKGTAIATALSYTLSLVSITIYVSLSKDIREAWFTPNRNCFNGLWDYLKLGISSTLMVCLEWWCFEALALLSGYISIDSTAAMIIVLNTNYIFFMFSSGLSVATSAHVGRAIGCQDVALAKRYAILSQVISLFQTLVICCVIFFGSELLARFYTNI